jgi:hypothetical protein
MNRKKSLNCLVIVMFLFFSVVFFTTSSTNVSAQRAKSNLTLEIGPRQTLGIGIDLAQMVLMFGGSFRLRKLPEACFKFPKKLVYTFWNGAMEHWSTGALEHWKQVTGDR